jgi:hypothetical protein
MPRIVRKPLDHATRFAGRFGAIYFITICCQRRGWNQLCHDETANVLVNTAFTSLVEKFAYICQNPVRAGLVRIEYNWPYIFIPDQQSRR